MKKSFESGKIWTILSAFIFVMTCGLIVFAGQYITKISSDEHFKDWRTEFLGQNKDGNPILTGGDWNAIMDSLNGLIIPHGAIMAFTGECPLGWTHFTAADGRFLMGVSDSDFNKILSKTGNNHIRLQADQLPYHSHTYLDTIFAEEYSDDLVPSGQKGIFIVDQSIATRGNYGRSDIDNNLVVGKRITDSTICKHSSDRMLDNYYGGCPNKANYVYTDVTNEHVKVRYCIKD